MKSFLSIMAFLIGQILFCQTKKIQIPTYRSNDTSFWYIWTRENIQKIRLQDLTTSLQPIHFRFWTESQAVDIWTSDNKTFEGKLISYTKAYDPNKYKTDNPKPEKFYSKSQNIDTTTARQIFDFLNNVRLFNLPSQDSIKGWSTGDDGDTYLVEYSTQSQYSFKDYWTPEIQKGIKEAEIIDKINKYLQTSLGLPAIWTSFINNLPKGCYHAGSMLLTCNNKK